MSPQQFEKGDRVRFMDFGEEGTVLAVSGVGMLEIEVDGMQMTVSSSEVVRVGAGSVSEETHLYDGNNRFSCFKQRSASRHQSVRTGKKAQRQAGRMEVDLHMDRIREKYPAARNIPDEEALYVQLDVFEKSMAEAFRKGMRSVVFIHGHGRGVLRSELLRRLRDYPGAVVQDNSRLSGDGGSVEVFLK